MQERERVKGLWSIKWEPSFSVSVASTLRGRIKTSADIASEIWQEKSHERTAIPSPSSLFTFSSSACSVRVGPMVKTVVAVISAAHLN